MNIRPQARPIVKAPVSTRIILEDGVLRPQSNLQRADYNAFQDACQKLSRMPVTEAYIDLTNCNYLSSLFIGVLVDTVTQMTSEGKEVRVLVSPEIGRLLHMAHLYHLFNYEITEPV